MRKFGNIIRKEQDYSRREGRKGRRWMGRSERTEGSGVLDNRSGIRTGGDIDRVLVGSVDFDDLGTRWEWVGYESQGRKEETFRLNRLAHPPQWLVQETKGAQQKCWC